MRMQQYTVVEYFDDGTSLVRTTGSYGGCALVYVEMLACGFKVRIEPLENHEATV